MKRTWLIVCLVATGMFANPRPASAGFWAWLEQFSGPGPFKTRIPPVLATFCPERVSQAATATAPASVHISLVPSPVSTNDRTLPFSCFYVDLASLTAPAEPPASHGGRGFPEIRVTPIDFGGSARLADGLDVGAGIGAMVFGVNGDVFSNFTVTPVRIVTRPILLAIPRGGRVSDNTRKALGIFSIYWKQTFVTGELTGQKFGVSDSTFRVDGEFVRSWGIIFDLTALIR